MLKTREKIDIKQIRFNLLRSRFTFTVITYLLSKIYDMLLSNTWYTKRYITILFINIIICFNKNIIKLIRHYLYCE